MIRSLYLALRERVRARLVRINAKRLQRATRIPHRGPDYFQIGRKDRF